MSASAKPTMFPDAIEIPSRIPRPLPRRALSPITLIAGFVETSSRARSRVPSFPSAATITSYRYFRDSKYSTTSLIVGTIVAASLKAGSIRLISISFPMTCVAYFVSASNGFRQVTRHRIPAG